MLVEIVRGIFRHGKHLSPCSDDYIELTKYVREIGHILVPLVQHRSAHLVLKAIAHRSRGHPAADFVALV